MGVILTGIIAAIVLAVGAGFVLRAEQEPAWKVYSTGSTRVGDPGHNLVGADFDGGSEASESDETPG